MIKYSSGLDYKKIYDKVTETRSCVYDDEIDDYSDALMIFEKNAFQMSLLILPLIRLMIHLMNHQMKMRIK